MGFEANFGENITYHSRPGGLSECGISQGLLVWCHQSSWVENTCLRHWVFVDSCRGSLVSGGIKGTLVAAPSRCHWAGWSLVGYHPWSSGSVVQVSTWTHFQFQVSCVSEAFRISAYQFEAGEFTVHVGLCGLLHICQWDIWCLATTSSAAQVGIFFSSMFSQQQHGSTRGFWRSCTVTNACRSVRFCFGDHGEAEWWVETVCVSEICSWFRSIAARRGARIFANRWVVGYVCTGPLRYRFMEIDGFLRDDVFVKTSKTKAPEWFKIGLSLVDCGQSRLFSRWKNTHPSPI